ncbi:hypothetical protein CPG37_04480 [Malaciobacter canalis]|uniref:HTH cro/C1-type domain-containing protein n=1 Tax=Malaciobacter canalis TaxID=1912871 RepID=A0ABX4LRC7_9BACT|nr:helix-turn-helix transcriptional regulator [Malaciobacter canalis]PHO10308.1 hypothetical protein CPG37_04480 [Malaciobacter canalis]QEE32413.1 putative transcriptional regulator, XRE family [Malaciobacter canalis]
MKKFNYTKIAKDLNVSHSAVSQWFSGKTKPTIDKVFKMQQNHNIPVEAWKDIKSFISNDTKTTDVPQIQIKERI